MAVTQSQITIILLLSFTFYILKSVHLVTGGAPAPGAPVVGTPLLTQHNNNNTVDSYITIVTVELQ